MAVCIFFTLGLGFSGQWLYALLPLAAAVIGWVLLPRIERTLGTVVFPGTIILAGIGAVSGLPLWSMLLAVTAGIVFWDVDALHNRLEVVETSDHTRQLEKSHFERLALAVVVGLVASLPGLFLKLNFNLLIAIFLGIIIILGIRSGIKELTQWKEKPE